MLCTTAPPAGSRERRDHSRGLAESFARPLAPQALAADMPPSVDEAVVFCKAEAGCDLDRQHVEDHRAGHQRRRDDRRRIGVQRRMCVRWQGGDCCRRCACGSGARCDRGRRHEADVHLVNSPVARDLAVGAVLGGNLHVERGRSKLPLDLRHAAGKFAEAASQTLSRFDRDSYAHS